MEATFENAENSEVINGRENNSFIYHQLLAGFWIRFWAYIIDLVVIGSINRIIIHPLFELLNLNQTFYIFSPPAIATSIIFFAYFVLMTKYFQQTLGKMIVGIKVMSKKNEEKIDWGTILFRELVGRYITKTIWILYVIVAFTPKKQGLHDIFSDTYVVHEKLYKAMVNESPEAKVG